MEISHDNKKQKNYLDAYIDKKKKCIIYIYGYPCTSKTKIGKLLACDIKLKYINANKYMDGTTLVNNMKIHEHPNNMQWNKLKEELLENDLVVVTSNYINADIEPDFVYFIGINKTLCRENLLEKNASKEDSKYIDPNNLDKYMSEVLFPLYEEQTKIVKINKFFNIKENTTDEDLYDMVFDQFISDLQKNVHKIYNIKDN